MIRKKINLATINNLIYIIQKIIMIKILGAPIKISCSTIKIT